MPPLLDMAESTPSASRTAAEALALVAFYLYFGGWVYAHAMFEHMGISLTLVDIPVYFFVVYAFSVFFTTCAGWILVISIGGTWYALSKYHFVRWAEAILIIGVATVPFPLIRQLADTRAQYDATTVRLAGKSVQLLPRGEAGNKYSADTIAIAKGGRLKLVLQTKEHYFAVLQGAGIKGKNDRIAYPPAKVYDLPAADFFAITMTRDTAR